MYIYILVVIQPENKDYLNNPQASENTTAIIDKVLSETWSVEGKDNIVVTVNMVKKKQNFQAMWDFQCKHSFVSSNVFIAVYLFALTSRSMMSSHSFVNSALVCV